jgi:hypothetical protein
MGSSLGDAVEENKKIFFLTYTAGIGFFKNNIFLKADV